MAINVQEYIQNLVPTQANNGNPNTAYNNSPIPVMDAFGNWSQPTVSPAATATYRRSTTAPWLNVGEGGTGLNLPVFPTLPPLTSTPFTPNVPSNGTGGGINPWTPPTQVGSTPTTGGSGGSRPPVTSGSTGNVGGGRDAMDVLSGGGISGVPSSGLPNITQPNYGAPAKPIDWLQVLDAVSEPFFPGNIWLSGTNEFDVSNTLESLAEQLGIPATQLLNFGTTLTGGIEQILNKDPSTWSGTEAALADRYLDNARNQLANQLSSIQTGMLGNIGQQSGAVVNQTVRDALAKLGLSYIPESSTAVQGGGGPRSSFMGTNVYASPEAREAAIAATQDALRQSASRSPNNRQTGGDMWGRAYEF